PIVTYDRGRNIPDYILRAATDQIYSCKNLYAINNNGARNIALREGRTLGKWVLPWDGNGFITLDAWDEIVKGVKDNCILKYIVVPMARIVVNDDLLSNDFSP